MAFPTSQRELLVAARGKESQAAFAKRLGVDRTCLSRYESERLGAPVAVVNFCLRRISNQLQTGESSPIQEALALMRRAADTLERVAGQEDLNQRS
ncbi:hypothetical protein ASD86_09275 [Lysobacter sp. Root690]|nr:hypothetical protein ASD86_09275 [Lysobacter sp. Root690]